MRYVCSNSRRLRAVAAAGVLNGIEYLEVRDTDEAVQVLRQRTLLVRLLQPVPATLSAANVLIDEGERIRSVAVEWCAPATALPAGVPAAEQAALLDGLAEPDHVLMVRTVARGDFSQYRLHLVAGPGTTDAPAGFDVLLTEVRFSFKIECPAEFDCAAPCTCGRHRVAAPLIDYLTKDYDGFRRLMLERMALLAPEWTERSAADVGVTLVELMAYVADELSYRQDAIATEAYLDTARSRISLRRHARLVDYRVHEGCNARAWVQIAVGSPVVVLPARTALLTRVPGALPRLEPVSAELAAALATRPVVFETIEDAVLHGDLNELRFYTWGEEGCCLPQGATSATLRGRHPDLRAGDVLVLAETLSPSTGAAPDADPTRRWAVRLVEVRDAVDVSGGLFESPPSNASVDVTEIRWHDDDALPFPLCLSIVEGALETASAWGNLVLADHGETIDGEALSEVPAPRLHVVRDDEACREDGPLMVPGRYRPALQRRPLTHTESTPPTVLLEASLGAGLRAELDARSFGPLLQALLEEHDLVLPAGTTVIRGAGPLWSADDGRNVYWLVESAGVLRVLAGSPPACHAERRNPRTAIPAMHLEGTLDGLSDRWAPKLDLIASDGSARELTVECETDGTAHVRFGDGEHGLRPSPGTTFVATYRVGNGLAGNVGAESIAHAVTTVAVDAVRNPLPAVGGVDPERSDEVRRDAPHAFAVQERAVTEDDYADVAQRNGQVQRARATFRWTGSWRTVFVTADRFENKPVDESFETELRAWLERYRMAGYDLEVDGPILVPLQLGLHVCVSPGHLRSDVAAGVRAALSDAVSPDGRRGLFHPDGLTFGQPVHVSSIYAAVHAVQGVESVDVHTFQRQRQPNTSALDAGVLPIGRLEIARLDDDPNFPERGVLELTLGGGT